MPDLPDDRAGGLVVADLTGYIVIERKPDQNSESGFSLDVHAGGSIATQDEMVSLLLLLVGQLTGVPAGLYAQEIDIARRAVGLAPLRRGGEGSPR